VKLSERGRRAYRHLRADGYVARVAYAIARRDELAAAALLPTDRPGTFELDARRLAAASRDAFEDSLSGVVVLDGVRKLDPIDAPDGVVVYVYEDYDADPWLSAECYDEDALDAYRRGDWWHVGVAVAAPDGREASMWGIECGPYWPGDELGQVWHVVPELVREVIA